MGMDHLNQEMRAFSANLRQFNETVAKDWDQLQAAWDRAAELWTDDEQRRRFDKDWGEMAAAMRIYRQQHAQKYEQFLAQRQRALDRYFGHG